MLCQFISFAFRYIFSWFLDLVILFKLVSKQTLPFSSLLIEALIHLVT